MEGNRRQSSIAALAILACLPLPPFPAAARAGEPDCSGEVRIEGAVAGYSPDPADVFAVAADPSSLDLHPLAGARVEARSSSEACPAVAVGEVGPDGAFALRLSGIASGAPYLFRVELGTDAFVILGGPDAFVRHGVELRGDAVLDVILNSERGEFGAFHLLVFHHLRRASEEAERVLGEQGLGWKANRTSRIEVHLSREEYLSAFDPVAGVLRLASDELLPEDELGLARKIVPTNIFQAYGREVVYRLSGEASGSADPSGSAVAEGLSDAFACFVARTSLLGYPRPDLPGADPAARDLRDDLVRYPEDPRRAIAGAFWELWESTLDPPALDRPALDVPPVGLRDRHLADRDLADRDPGDPDLADRDAEGLAAEGPVSAHPRSSFAFGLLLRWLAARGAKPEPEALRYDPWIGQELYLEADAEALGGDGNLRNGFPHDAELIRAFGRRNLFQYLFVRGDANLDGVLDIADPISVLRHLFIERGEPTCYDAMDVDDNGRIEVTDAVRALGHLFLGGGEPAAPFPSCGPDPTPGDGMPCWQSACRIIPPH